MLSKELLRNLELIRSWSKILLLETFSNQVLEKTKLEWLCSWLDSQKPLALLPLTDSVLPELNHVLWLPPKLNQDKSILVSVLELNKWVCMICRNQLTQKKFLMLSLNTHKLNYVLCQWESLVRTLLRNSTSLEKFKINLPFHLTRRPLLLKRMVYSRMRSFQLRLRLRTMMDQKRRSLSLRMMVSERELLSRDSKSWSQPSRREDPPLQETVLRLLKVLPPFFWSEDLLLKLLSYQFSLSSLTTLLLEFHLKLWELVQLSLSQLSSKRPD